jgi:hypothetical protein
MRSILKRYSDTDVIPIDAKTLELQLVNNATSMSSLKNVNMIKVNCLGNKSLTFRIVAESGVHINPELVASPIRGKSHLPSIIKNAILIILERSPGIKPAAVNF